MKHKFSENVLKKKMRLITIGTCIAAAVIIIFLGLTIYKVREANQMSHDIMTEGYVNEYKINMERQFNSDFESLQLLLEFIQNNIYVNYENFTDGLEVVGQESPFLRLAYYGVDGKFTSVVFSEDIEADIPYEKLSEEMKAALQKAWAGENVVSEVYQWTKMGSTVLTYAIPVKDKNSEAITGALVATKDIEDFREILDRKTLSDENLHIDWINRNGDIIKWSENHLTKEEIHNIFDNTSVSVSDKAQVVNKIEKSEEFESQFKYDGETYHIYFQPLDYNDWYLLYVDKGENIVSPIFTILNTVITLFSIVFAAGIIALMSLYCSLKNTSVSFIESLFYDDLTKAWNVEKLKEEFGLSVGQKKKAGIVSFNIRDFRFINEIIGRTKADQLLQVIINAFQSVLPEGSLYARENADQFYLCLYECDEESINKYINLAIDKILGNVLSQNINYQICFNVGIYIVSNPKAEDIDLYIELSDFAKKQCIRNGEDSFVFYNETMETKKSLESYIESHKVAALKNGEFEFFLQPKFNLKKNVIDGAEALVRWRKEDGTYIFPDEFIPLFEQNGFCIQLDLYMFEKACQKIRSWIDRGIEPINISVNQSKLLFYRADYVGTLKALLDKYTIPRNLITLEILEGLATENIDKLNDTFSELQKIGLMISLDDFGTGYSSLNLLSSFNIDEIKFDRQFLLEKSSDKKQKNLLCMRSIIEYTKQLKLATVVEGVEQERDIEYLREMSCHQAQGYYFSKPINENEFDRLFMESSYFAV